jgi:hypothetical protein
MDEIARTSSQKQAQENLQNSSLTRVLFNFLMYFWI